MRSACNDARAIARLPTSHFRRNDVNVPSDNVHTASGLPRMVMREYWWHSGRYVARIGVAERIRAIVGVGMSVVVGGGGEGVHVRVVDRALRMWQFAQLFMPTSRPLHITRARIHGMRKVVCGARGTRTYHHHVSRPDQAARMTCARLIVGTRHRHPRLHTRQSTRCVSVRGAC